MTFGVIIVTLVGIGLTLPILVRLLGLSDHGRLEAVREREAEISARREILRSARGSLDRIIKERNLPEGLARFLEARHETRMRALPEPPREEGQVTPATQGASLVREIITIERTCLHRLLREEGSPTKHAGASSAISILKKLWSITARRTARCDGGQPCIIRRR